MSENAEKPELALDVLRFELNCARRDLREAQASLDIAEKAYWNALKAVEAKMLKEAYRYYDA